MATIIGKDDFRTIISIAVIDKLTGGDDGIINELIDTAVEEMKSYLRSRYDVAYTFDSGAGTMLIKMYLKDITLYHLFSRSNQSQIPIIRDTRYKQAITWLNNVQEQIINPVGMQLLTDSEKSLVKTGGNTKRNNHQE